MDYQNYLYLEYRRAIRKFRKLQTRFEKRIANDTFQELTTQRRYKLLSQLRKLKQKIEQLTSRLKLAAAGGSLAFTMAFALDGSEVSAQGVPGVAKSLNIDKTLANDLTIGSQENPDIDINNDGNFAVVWEGADGSLRGKAYGGDVDQSLDFEIPFASGFHANPAIAVNNEDEFIVAWQESAFAIKYMRYEVEEGEIQSDGPYTANTGTESTHDPAVAMDDEGNFVITWEQANGDEPGIKARYYTADNQSDGVIAVSNNTNYDQDSPAVDIDNEGNFIVVWKDQEEPDPLISVIRGRKYTNGLPNGSIMDLASDSNDQLFDPDVDLNGDGSFVVAWEDAVNSGTTEYIRARMFDTDGTATTAVMNIGTSAYVDHPNIAADKDGGFVVVFSTIYMEGDKIFANRYNRFGEQIESQEIYSNSYTGNTANNPTIGMNDRGDFMVAWDDNLSAVNAGECTPDLDCDNEGVYFKQYKGADNEPYCKSDEGQVNDYSTGGQYSPSVDVDQNGNYVIVWEGAWHATLEQGTGIIGQRYNADGTKNGSEFQVNTTTTSNQGQPSVAMHPSGNFIVVWPGFGQLFFADGSKNGSEFQINASGTNSSVEMNTDGDAVVVWEGSGDGIYGRLIESDGQFGGDEFRVDASTVSGNRIRPDVALDDDGNFAVVWAANDSYGYNQTFFRRFDASAAALDTEDVTISTGVFNDRYQGIAVDPVSGDFIIAYSEQGSSSQVLASKYDNAGNPVFEDKLMTQNAYTFPHPSVATNANGDFAISWYEYDSFKAAAFTVFNDEDEEIYGWDQIQSDDTSEQHTTPAIALDDNANTIVAYGDNSGGYNVHTKTIGKPFSGNIDDGIEFIVNSKTTKDQTNPDIAQNADGDFVVVWQDTYVASFAEHHIRAQRYTKEGIRLGSEMIINDETNQTASDPSVALMDDGKFMVVWRAYSPVGGEDDDILGSVYDWDGTVVKGDFIINDETNYHQRKPDITVNHEGDFQVVWTERYSFTTPWNKLYAQTLSSDGVPDPEGNQFLFDTGETANVNMEASVAVNDEGDMAVPYIFDSDGITNGFFVFDDANQMVVNNLAFGESSSVNARRPALTTNEDGDFILAWSEYDLGNSIYNLMVRAYEEGGEFEASPVKIGEQTGQADPSIAAVDDGDFIISYTEHPDESEHNIKLRRVNRDFEAIGPDILINEINASGSSNNAIASSPNGNYTIVWQSSSADNSDDAIMARQFVSHKPTIDNQGVAIDEGTEGDIDPIHLTFDNPSGGDQSAVLTVNQLPTKGTLKLNGNGVELFQELDDDDMLFLTYEHDGSESTHDLFTFSVANDDFETDNHTFDITVNPVNDAPTVDNAIDNQNAVEGEPFDLTLEANVFSDAEGDELTLTATLADGSELPGWLTFTAGTGQFTGTPDAGGDFIIRVGASDGSLSVSDEFELSVTNVNDIPVVANPLSDQSTDQFEPYSFVIPENTFSDADGEELTLSASLDDDSALPTWLTFNELTRTLAGTPAEDGAIDIKIRAHDGEGQSATSTFKLTINFVLDAATLEEGLVKYYPNPVENILHLKPETHMMGDIQVYLFNQSGKIVRSEMIYKTSQAQVFDFDVQYLMRGLYFVKMINDNTTSTFKISKK